MLCAGVLGFCGSFRIFAGNVPVGGSTKSSSPDISVERHEEVKSTVLQISCAQQECNRVICKGRGGSDG